MATDIEEVDENRLETWILRFKKHRILARQGSYEARKFYERMARRDEIMIRTFMAEAS
jgi:hypothetical protein